MSYAAFMSRKKNSSDPKHPPFVCTNVGHKAMSKCLPVVDLSRASKRKRGAGRTDFVLLLFLLSGSKRGDDETSALRQICALNKYGFRFRNLFFFKFGGVFGVFFFPNILL